MQTAELVAPDGGHGAAGGAAGLTHVLLPLPLRRSAALCQTNTSNKTGKARVVYIHTNRTELRAAETVVTTVVTVKECTQ